MDRRGFLRFGLAGSVLAVAGASFDPLARSQAAEQARSLNLKTTDLKTLARPERENRSRSGRSP